MTRCAASILLSPRVKAIIEPIMIPQMPPIAIPSRNMRLRNNVIVDHLFAKLLQIYHRFCCTPQAFQPIILSFLWAEDVYDDISKVQQQPTSFCFTFAMKQVSSLFS